MKEIMDVLAPVLGEDLAKDIIAHRKGLKCPLTARGAKALLKQYQLAGDPIAAAEHHLNMGWRGFDASWMKPKTNFRDEHNPMPVRQSANYGKAEVVEPPKPLSPEEMARRREATQRILEAARARTVQ